MNNNISIFSHPEFGEIRTMTMPDGQIGFVGKDVAEVLGYSIPQKAIIEHVDFEDRTVLTYKAFSKTEKASLWGNNDFSNKVIINESGLYALILSSKLPQAREFKHWVTSVVLPQIRKTGGYIPVDKEDDDKTILCKAVKILMNTVEMQKQELAEQDIEIARLAPKAEYAEEVLLSPTCYTMTQVAKSLLAVWLNRGHIKEVEMDVYEKVNFRSPL